MQTDSLKNRWRAGETTLNGWLHIPAAWSAEVMAHQGWDSLTLDMQHGLIDYPAALEILQAVRNMPCFVRVAWNDPAAIMRVLDAGAQGIICPMVNTRAETERFIGACRYAPQGYRSYGPTRAALVYGADYGMRANEEVLTFAMIETAEALDHLDQIAATPGLDGLYVGPTDLSLSLYGEPRPDSDDPHFVAILERIVNAAQTHGLATGIFTISVQHAQRMEALGFGWITVMSDTRLLASAAQATVQALRSVAD